MQSLRWAYDLSVWRIGQLLGLIRVAFGFSVRKGCQLLQLLGLIPFDQLFAFAMAAAQAAMKRIVSVCVRVGAPIGVVGQMLDRIHYPSKISLTHFIHSYNIHSWSLVTLQDAVVLARLIPAFVVLVNILVVAAAIDPEFTMPAIKAVLKFSMSVIILVTVACVCAVAWTKKRKPENREQDGPCSICLERTKDHVSVPCGTWTCRALALPCQSATPVYLSMYHRFLRSLSQSHKTTRTHTHHLNLSSFLRAYTGHRFCGACIYQLDRCAACRANIGQKLRIF